MFRILTNKQIATFKEGEKIYEIKIDRRVDNKAHIIVKEIFIDKVAEVVFNQYEQAKSIAKKDIQVFEALEEFYPSIVNKEVVFND